MNKILIYHNPRWSKSRESVKILENSGKDYEIIDYIKSPLSIGELKAIAKKMDFRPKDFIRKGEGIFKELNLKEHINDDETIFQYMLENPKLIERPIIVSGDKAVLGRPPEKVNEIINM